MLRAIILTVLFLLSATLRAEYFTIEAYDLQVRIDAGGWFEVEETIDVFFTSPRHGIFRYIPYRYLVDDKVHKIGIKNIDVPGHRWERSWVNGNVRIRIGDPDAYVEGQQRYVIRYRVRNALLFPEGHTEFYWNLIGNGWEVAIDTITYRIDLPAGVTLAEADYRVFTGQFGEQEKEATIDYRPGVVTGHSLRSFGPGEGLTVALKLPLTAVRRPTVMEQLWRQYGSLAVPLGLLLFTLILWYRYGYNPGKTTVTQYYPPEGMPPAEAGLLFNRYAKKRSVVALLPYWASQGLIRIEELAPKTGPEKRKKKVDLNLVRLQDLPKGRPAYERWMWEAIFEKDAEEVRLSKLKNSLYATTLTSGDQIVETLRRQGHYPSKLPVLWLWVLPILLFVAFPFIIVFLVLEQPITAVALILVIAAGFVLRYTSKKKTKKGLAAYQHLKGFREFIVKADQPRLERLLQDDPAYFERTLPYAVAFGLTGKWVAHFGGLFSQPPSWYVPARTGVEHATAFAAFSSNLGPGLREVGSVFTSAPASSYSGSSSSGGFSGGSSGGGFGGGGGGSW